MKPAFIWAATTALCLQLSAAPAAAEMSHDQKVAAAAALLGIVAVLHNKHHYKGGYAACPLARSRPP